jgi:large subunit ribosomal protein L31
MREGIHPDYHLTRVHCACGNSFDTRSAAKDAEIRVEVCSVCHPFYTGRQRAQAAGGRIERFQQRLEKAERAKRADASRASNSR